MSICVFLFDTFTANDFRVVLSSENDQSDYICASYVDVSKWKVKFYFRFCRVQLCVLD